MNKEYIITVFSENKVGLLARSRRYSLAGISISKAWRLRNRLSRASQIYHSRHHRSRKDRETGQADRKENRCTESLCFHPGWSGTTGNRTLQSHPEQQCRKIGTRPPWRILEICDDYIVLEKTGHKEDTQSLFELLQPHGVQQFVRSGQIAIIKSKRELLNEYLQKRENTTKA